MAATLASVATATIVMASPVIVRAETTVLAASQTHHVKVLADGTPAWCGPDLHLRLQLGADSPELADMAGQSRLLSRLKTPIEAMCKLARTAVAVSSGPGAASATFAAEAAGGWMFAPISKLAAAAPPSGPAASAASPAPSEEAPFQIPRDIGYPSLVIAIAHQHPDLLSDQMAIRYWAQYRFGNQYNRVSGQEFKLQPLLARAREDLRVTIANTPPRTMVVAINIDFGQYDFDRHVFPIHIGGDQLQLYDNSCCQQSDKLPRNVTLHASGLDTIDSLPMQAAEAQRFVEGRSRYGSVDRQLTLLLSIRLNAEGIPLGPYSQSLVEGTVVGAVAVSGRRMETLVYRYSASQLAALRDARTARDTQTAREAETQRGAQARDAARQQAEVTRQQLLSQNQYMLGALQSEPVASRLRDFMMPGAQVGGAELNNLRDARGEALLAEAPRSVVMLVRTDSSGTSGVATSWPGHLVINLPAGAHPLTSGNWYLVSGPLSVPQGEDLPDAQLRADTLFACAREECADAAEPSAIVQRKLAQAGASAASP